MSWQISQRVFALTRSEHSTDYLLPEGMLISGQDASKGNCERNTSHCGGDCLFKAGIGNNLLSGEDDRSNTVPFELYKRRTTAFVRRETFLDIVCDALSEYKYVGPNQRGDLLLACRYGVILYHHEDYFNLL